MPTGAGMGVPENLDFCVKNAIVNLKKATAHKVG